MITPLVTSGLSALAEHAPGLLETVFCVYISLVVILAMVARGHAPGREVPGPTPRRCWIGCSGTARVAPGAEPWWDSR
jgi:hypothetical protein